MRARTHRHTIARVCTERSRFGEPDSLDARAQARIASIYSTLDEDESGGLSYNEFRHNVKSISDNIHITRVCMYAFVMPKQIHRTAAQHLTLVRAYRKNLILLLKMANTWAQTTSSIARNSRRKLSKVLSKVPWCMNDIIDPLLTRSSLDSFVLSICAYLHFPGDDEARTLALLEQRNQQRARSVWGRAVLLHSANDEDFRGQHAPSQKFSHRF